MSKISTIYDALITRLTTLYPTHKRLANPYTPSENNALLLTQGWGLAVGVGVNTEEFLGCKLSIDRQFTVVHTRKYIALEADAVTKADVEKALFEDQFLLFQDLEEDITLSGLAVNVKFVSDSGLEFVQAGNDKFLLISSVLTAKYYEVLS